MIVQTPIVQKLSHLFYPPDATGVDYSGDDQPLNLSHEQINRAFIKAQREWSSAIASLENLLLATLNLSAEDNPIYEGVILSGTSTILSHPQLLSALYSGVFTPEAFLQRALTSSSPCNTPTLNPTLPSHIVKTFPLLPQDPLITEQFCLVLTPQFGLVIVLGENAQGLPVFEFSFAPEIIQGAWQALRSRLQLTNHPQLCPLDTLIEHLNPPNPDYRLVMEFSRQLLKNLPHLPSSETRKPRPVQVVDEEVAEKAIADDSPSCHPPEIDCPSDVELLQALTHEIRTPLTTIRTMTRLLLKRARVAPEMLKCLETIDQECTEQINRMELIFRASQWGTSVKDKKVQLVPMSVTQIFEQIIPSWKKQASRRNVELDVIMPQKLPQVVSDPGMLEQMLTGLIEKFTRSVAQGGQIRLEVTPAGNQLKLEFQTQCNYHHNPFKALGQFLLLQPDTGSLTLNLDITKTIFQALGGKLTVRQRSEQGEVFTIFLPLGTK